MSCDVLGESNLLQDTVSDVSECMFHGANITTDSWYHSPNPTVPTHLDAFSGTMVPGSVHNVPCPFPKGEALVTCPGKMDEILSPVPSEGHKPPRG